MWIQDVMCVKYIARDEGDFIFLGVSRVVETVLRRCAVLWRTYTHAALCVQILHHVELRTAQKYNPR